MSDPGLAPDDFVVVLVTVPDPASGERIATALVEERLAACVNRIPGVTSLFRWQGQVESAGEELLLVKARKSCLDDLERRVVALHPYDVPEVLALPVHFSSAAYLRWLHEETDP